MRTLLVVIALAAGTAFAEDPCRGLAPLSKSRSAAKRKLLERAVHKAPVKVFIDARCRGVVVPDEHAKSWDLVLSFSPRFEPADLEFTADGVSETLSFSKKPFKVVVPWYAIYAFAFEGEAHTIYEPDVPLERQQK